ncbi:MAG: hypothetical protein ACLFP8_00040 [Alphaproteobacteria bacterium]
MSEAMGEAEERFDHRVSPDLANMIATNREEFTSELVGLRKGHPDQMRTVSHTMLRQILILESHVFRADSLPYGDAVAIRNYLDFIEAAMPDAINYLEAGIDGRTGDYEDMRLSSELSSYSVSGFDQIKHAIVDRIVNTDERDMFLAELELPAEQRTGALDYEFFMDGHSADDPSP